MKLIQAARVVGLLDSTVAEQRGFMAHDLIGIGFDGYARTISINLAVGTQ